MMKLMFLSIIFVFYFDIINVKGSEICTVDNLSGTCEGIRHPKCKAILQNYQRHRIWPVKCDSLVGTVCCPNKVPPPPSPTGPSGLKCQEYSDKIYNNGHCQRAAVSLIIGGENATQSEFPHSVLIGYEESNSDDDYLCGGSLISERFVLSAAHCSWSREFGVAKYAKLGNVVRGVKNDLTFKYEIIQRIKHPNYTATLVDHDIALFKLDRDVEFSSYVAPICLPHFNIKSKEATATGWGHVGYSESLSKGLLKVKMSIFKESECQAKYTIHGKIKNAIDYESKVCAGSYTEMKDTCGGDSGGPLQVFNVNDVRCMYHIVGITAFGHLECGHAGIPGVYTRVFHYLNWIEGIVWPEFLD